jgi:hypothetical protein
MFAAIVPFGFAVLTFLAPLNSCEQRGAYSRSTV